MDSLVSAARAPMILVAHPDDETLWAGGLLVRYAHKNWTVVCCTVPHADPIRAEKFRDACAVFKARPVVVFHPERGGPIPLPPINADLVITHGPAGEYGHPQHKELHCLVAAGYNDKAIYFGYGEPVPTHTLALTDAEWQQKLAALKCYDHVSVTDRKPKWEALLEYYGTRFDLRREPYVRLPNAAANGIEAQGNPLA